MRVLFIVAVVGTSIIGFAEEATPTTSARPVALIAADTSAKVIRAGRKGNITLYAADELFAGDTLLPSGERVPVLYCSSGKGWIAEHSSDTVITAQVPPGARLVEPVCRLPLLDRTGFLGGDVSKIEDPPEQPLPGLPACSPDCTLPTLVTRIAMLQEANFPKHTIREIRRLLVKYPDLAWAKRLAETEALRASTPAPPRQRTQALLIGISEYQHESVSHLQYAHQDAALFSSFLESARGGKLRRCPPGTLGIASPDCDIRLLQNKEATGAVVSAAIDDLFKSRGPEDAETTLILFIAAHGYFPCLAKADPANDADPPDCSAPAEDRKTYILTYDSSPESAAEIAVPFLRIAELLARHASRYKRVLVYLDVCHSGVVPWLAAQNVVPPAASLTAPVRRARQLGIMSATSRKEEERKKEFAYESGVVQHGIFTYYLVAGLAGARPPATGQKLEFDWLHTWVEQEVMTATAGQQKPDGKNAGTLIVVDDDSVRDFPFPPAKPEDIARTLDFKNRTPRARSIGVPATADAGEILERLRRNARQDPLAAKRLEIALENSGNQAIFDYLQGDQVRQDPATFERCGRLFAEALTLAPGSTRHESRMLFCRARASLYDPNKIQDVIRDLQRAIRLDPERAYAYNALGLAYLQQVPDGVVDPSLAAAAFGDAIRISPHWAYPRHNLALLYALTGEYDKAVETYLLAMQVRPDVSYLPYNLALLYQKLNMRDEAISALKHALAVEEQRRKWIDHPPKEWTDRAAIECAMGTLESRSSRAISRYDAALSHDPDYLPALHNKALALISKGRYPEAVQIWKRVVAADATFTAARIAWADEQRKHGDLTGAAEQYRAVIGQLPRYIGAYRSLAQVETAHRRFDDAIRALRRALSNTMVPSVREELLLEIADIEAVRDGRKAETSDYRRIQRGLARS